MTVCAAPLDRSVTANIDGAVALPEVVGSAPQICVAFQGFTKDQTSTWADPFSMANATDFKAHLALLAALIGVATVLPLQWRTNVERTWSYGVYYVGYRLLSVQLTCGSLAVSALPLVAKHA